ncbi:MAG TPA: lytic transglycosylase domain-containing protein [Kiloniellales bacterium]|nr:lytic transglycosylase domain-containing protein [Kiloniellales bacterium]
MAVRLWCCALILAIFALLPRAASAAEQVGVVPVDDRGLPLILSAADAERYRQIFALQEAGQMGQADELIFQLQDQRLLGHVLAQRYLHPTAWKSKHGELKSWLLSYSDHPEAEDIYELAVKKGGKSGLQKPYVSPASLSGPVESAFQPYRSEKDRTAAQAKRVSDLKGQIRKYLKDDNLAKALQVVEGKDAQRLLDLVELDQAYAQIAQAWYFAGDDLKALELAAAAAERSGSYVPAANWIAGLAAWRQGSFDLAAQHFEAVALSDRVNSWLASGGAYWAARAHLRRRDPAEMSHWLSLAAEYPRTFYGQLARDALGLKTQFDFRTFQMTQAGVQLLAASPTGGRAMALLQVGQDALAEQELLLLETWDSAEVTEVLLAIADRAQLARFAFKLANRLADADGNNRSGRPLLGALYPVPPWQPPSGYFVDEALVYALIRQESAFDPGAKSHAGARGLMQIMPRTASYVAGDGSLKGSQKDTLFDPALNLQLGQEYLVHLMSLGEVGNDLFRLCAAYNGGPGNLIKWQRETNFAGDPLLFIESIPAAETRDYIERVLANYWIYSARLGKATPSLSDIADGDWPRYQMTVGRQAAN